jgi:hypothetical protein
VPAARKGIALNGDVDHHIPDGDEVVASHGAASIGEN